MRDRPAPADREDVVEVQQPDEPIDAQGELFVQGEDDCACLGRRGLLGEQDAVDDWQQVGQRLARAVELVDHHVLPLVEDAQGLVYTKATVCWQGLSGSSPFCLSACCR